MTVAGTIDYETVNSYSLGIAATDGLNVSAPETVVLDVYNLNDVAPVVAPTQVFNIGENSINGASVGTVAANDVDSAITSFTIVSGNTNNAFAIDTSGVITVSSAIDYETIASYTLGSTATDGANVSTVVMWSLQ